MVINEEDKKEVKQEESENNANTTTPVWQVGTTPSGSNDKQSVYFPSAKSVKQEQKPTVDSNTTTDNATTNDGGLGFVEPNKVDAQTLNYDDYGESAYDYVSRLLADRVESPDEQKKRERREAASGVVNGIADTARALANLHYVKEYAPNGYDHEKSASKAHDARLEKARKEREANRNYYTQYALSMGGLKDKERAGRMSVAQYNASQRQAAQLANQKAVATHNQLLLDAWKEAEKMGLDRDKLEENSHQFKVKSEITKADLALRQAKFARDNKKGELEIGLGNGHGSVTLSPSQVNSANIALVYKTLPQEYQNMAQGTPRYVTDERSGEKKINGHNPPDQKTMLAVISYYLEEKPDEASATRAALRDIAKDRKTAPLGTQKHAPLD